MSRTDFGVEPKRLEEMFMDIQLVALDMDGTTLNTDLEITLFTKEMINEAIDQGVEIVMCTGRTICELEDLLQYIPGIRYIISGNGSGIWDVQHKHRLYVNAISYSKSMEILKRLKKYDMRIEAFCDGEIYMNQYCYDHLEDYEGNNFVDFLRKTRTPVKDIVEFIKERGQSVDKFNLFFRTLKDRQNTWNEFVHAGFSVTSSFGKNMEVNSHTANKGNALKYLANQFHIPENNIMAIGDEINDLSMLSFAGWPIAMGNAAQAVKDHSIAITKSNDEDGVAVAIQKYILNKS